MTALDLIAAERQRQISVEGWTPEHDDEHDGEQLACAAAYYALPPAMRTEVVYFQDSPGHLAWRPLSNFIWPWTDNWRKATPNNRERELIKAAAMLVAEIERMQRAREAGRT